MIAVHTPEHTYFTSPGGRYVIGLALLLVWGLTGCAAQEEEPDYPVVFTSESIPLDGMSEARAAFTPTLEGPLRPLSVAPYGTMTTLPRHMAVSITFSRPMVPLGEAPSPPADALTLDPTVPGQLRWIGTQTLVFTPESPLPYATPYHVIVSAGLASLDGQRLAEPYRWTFETPRPQLTDTEPDDGARYADPSAPIRLTFNQPVDLARAGDYLRLFRLPDRSPVTMTVAPGADSLTLVLTPRQPLAPGTRYALEIRAGLPSGVGPLGMAEDQLLTFTTYGPLQVMGLSARGQDARGPFDPAQGILLTFSNPVRFGSLRQALTFDPPVTWPPGIEALDERTSTTHTLPPMWAPETRYRVTIAGLTDLFGQRLELATLTFRTRPFRPAVRMPEGVLVLEAPSPALPVHVTNIEEARVGLRRLAPEEIIPLLRQYDPTHYYGMLPDTLAAPEVPATEKVVLTTERNRPVVTPLSLVPALMDATGVVAVHLRVPSQRGERRERSFRALAQVTRLGITAKFSPFQNLVVVTDLATASPVASARVTLRDASNRQLWEGTTDQNGRASPPGWATLGLPRPNEYDPPPVFVFVEKDGDLAFTASLYNDGLEPYRFDLPFDWWPEARTDAGSIFSDRGLYRAGETVYLKGVLRTRAEADWRPLTDSVRVLIQSPRDEYVLDRRLLPGPLGTFDLAWTTPANAALGAYTVRVVHATDSTARDRPYYGRGDITRGTFRVDAFRTAGFAVEASIAAPSYIAGDFFEGRIDARYLFGAPMGGQPVRYTLTRSPHPYSPPALPGYRFGLIEGYDLPTQTLARGDTLLAPDGTLALRLRLPGAPRGGAARLLLEATVTDPARQELSARATVTLHPGLFYIGLRPATTFLDLSQRSEMTVDVATVDPLGGPVDASGITVTLIRRQWNSVREVGIDGRLRWRSELSEEPLGTQRIDVEAGRARRLHLPIERGGSYVIRAEGTDVRGNTIRTETYFYATGAGYVAWARSDDDRIDLIPERTTYRPGETARLMVASPFEEATAVITVERDGILSSEVRTLVGSTPQISLPIREEHLPNVYVSVILLQGRSAAPSFTSDPGAPAFKIGYAALRVDPNLRHLSVEILPEKELFRPSEEATVRIQVRDHLGRGVPGEVTFAAVDAGVLNLIGYRLPDPFEAFYGPRPLKVLTAESRANLVRQRSYGQKEEDVGGGGGDADYLLRQDFRPLAHWAPTLQTDAEGQASVTFTLPQSLTTYRLMAVAVAPGNLFGATSRDVLVSQPLVLQPALPRFARRHDAFEAGVLVSNRTEEPGIARVTARGEGLTLTGPATQDVSLAPGETKELRFAWAAEQVGEARVSFEAAMNDERDALAWEVPVLPPLEKDVTATFASTETSVQESLTVPADAVPGLGGLTVRLSSTALVGLDGATRYLFSYPYGCIEQSTSRVRPLLVAGNLLNAFDLQALGAQRHEVIDAWLASLESYWTGEGFSLWPGSRIVNPYVSAYVVLALAEARAAGLQVPETLTAEAVDALERQVRHRSRRPEYYPSAVWNDTRALMLYALARHDRFLEDEAFTLAETLLRDPRSSVEGQSLMLRTVARANSRVLSQLRPRLLDRLRSRVRVEADRAYFSVPTGPGWPWIFASDTRATAFAMTALIEAAPGEDTQRLAERMIRYLMQQRASGHWSTTQENAAVVEALATFFASFESTPPDFIAEVRVGGQMLLRESFAERSLQVAAAGLPLDELREEEQVPIEIKKVGTGRLYYSLLLEAYRDEPVSALDRGLSVSRTLQRLDRQGRPVGTPFSTEEAGATLQAGDLVQITLRLSSRADRHYVVVDDALPAGLEALNAALETTSRTLTEDTGQNRWWGSFNHTEIHDDRVLLFADYLRRGEHTYTYVARATTPGRFVHPPSRAEMMYAPAVYGHTATGTLTVRPSPPETAQR